MFRADCDPTTKHQGCCELRNKVERERLRRVNELLCRAGLVSYIYVQYGRRAGVPKCIDLSEGSFVRQKARYEVERVLWGLRRRGVADPS
jgi:hypothetical protein